MAIFSSTNPSGIFVGVRAILPKEKYMPNKTIYSYDSNSPITPTGGSYYYNNILNNRFIHAGTGAWESA